MHHLPDVTRGARSGGDKYAGIARWYDPVTAPFLRAARTRLVRLCRERRFTRVLDMGCGTGLVAKSLDDAGVAVTCVEESPSMLALARKRLPASVPCVLAGYPLPFFPGFFDAAILALVLHESDSDPAALLAEALRVAPACIVLEWRMPERNIDYLAQPLVHCIERLAGGEHYANFRRFAGRGYLHGITVTAGGRVVHEEPFAAGALVLAEVSRAAQFPCQTQEANMASAQAPSSSSS